MKIPSPEIIFESYLIGASLISSRNFGYSTIHVIQYQCSRFIYIYIYLYKHSGSKNNILSIRFHSNPQVCSNISWNFLLFRRWHALKKWITEGAVAIRERSGRLLPSNLIVVCVTVERIQDRQLLAERTQDQMYFVFRDSIPLKTNLCCNLTVIHSIFVDVFFMNLIMFEEISLERCERYRVKVGLAKNNFIV